MPIDPPLHSAGRGMVSVASEPRVKRVWRFQFLLPRQFDGRAIVAVSNGGLPW
jgi:hypothetical protein